jgi:hypothetical protein
MMQAAMAVLGTTTAQRGPMWWAAWHRHHHRHSDDHPGIHSPLGYGVLWSHLFWSNSDRGVEIDAEQWPDLLRFPELRVIERFHSLGPLGLAAAMFVLGWGLANAGVNTNGAQMLVWGFGVSTVVLYHGTFTINSLAHLWGGRRFKTEHDSRNNLALALVCDRRLHGAHEVTGFEKEGWIGGHTPTVDVRHEGRNVRMDISPARGGGYAVLLLLRRAASRECARPRGALPVQGRPGINLLKKPQGALGRIQ